MAYFVTWILLSFLVGYLGNSRRIGFGAAFLTSLILSPLIGFIITMFSATEEDEKLKKVLIEQVSKSSEIDSRSASQSNYISDLHKLKELLDANLITKEEFDKEKAKLDALRF